MMGGFVGRLLAWWCALACGAALLHAAPAQAQSPLNWLHDLAGDSQISGRDFFAAALIASGVEDECELPGWIHYYAEQRQKVLANVDSGSPADRLRAIHAALHARILTGKYQTTASDLRLALGEGDFNCLSALAIYFDLCQSAGLDVEIWMTRGHVYLCASQDGETVMIEPGSPHWNARQLPSSARARQLSPAALLAKFYYNRGIGLLEDHQFAAGLDLLKTSLALDPEDGDARANLVAGLNNWAVDHCRAQRYRDAAPLIQQGLLLDPCFAPLVANERLVHARLSE